MVGQHVPRRRGRRRLAPLLVLVQAARLDAHARPAARAAAVPRGDRRRVRPAPAPAARCRPWSRRRGTTTAHVWTVASRRRHRRRVPRARERGRLPQRAALSRLARARRLRGAEVPHRALGARARPDRQGRRGRRHRLVGHADRARHPADRAAALRVPAGARVGHAEGRARLHRRGARGLRQPVAAPARSAGGSGTCWRRACGAGICTGPAPRPTRRAGSSAATTSTASSPTGPTCARRSRRTTRIPGKRPIFASTFYPALKKENVELVPRAVASVTPTGIVDADGVRAGRRRAS